MDIKGRRRNTINTKKRISGECRSPMPQDPVRRPNNHFRACSRSRSALDVKYNNVKMHNA